MLEEFDSNVYPMWAFDKQTLVLLKVNDAAVRRLGFSREEFEEMTLKDFLGSDDLTAVMQACIHNPSAGLPRRVGPLNLRRKDGTVMAADLHCHAIPFDGKDAIFLLASPPRTRGHSPSGV
jgi:PAS domain S-box-containing protein